MSTNYRVFDAQTGTLDDLLDNNPPAAFVSQDGWIVMQWTGFNDVHGAPIYEGDITSSGTVRHGVYYDYRPNLIGPYACFGWYLEKWWLEVDGWPLQSEISGGDFSRIEIVGNLHEHPELIERFCVVR